MALARDFRNAACLDLSPDGSKIALYSTGYPITTFRLGASGATRVNSRQGDGELAVLDIATGERIISRTEPRLPSASFFADGQRLFVQSSWATGKTSVARSRLVMSLAGANKSETQTNEYSDQTSSYLYALDDGRLLGVEFHYEEHQKDSLLVALLPDYAEAARIELPTPGDGDANLNVLPSFTADRTRFVYKRGRSVVARQSKDLGTLWRHAIDASAWGAIRAEYSQNGNWVVVAVRGGPTEHYVEVLNGDSGKSVMRLSINGDNGVGISSDGRHLAVAKQSPVPGGTQVESRVSILEVSSGKEISSVVLTESAADHAFLEGGFGYHGIRFTPDDRYLIGSGNHTKVWKIG